MTHSRIDRREALALLASAPIASAFACTPERIARAQQAVSGDYTLRFFTPHEYDTVCVLADLFIPRDERSGSASDARVPELMDFMMSEQPESQIVMRGGLAWLDVTCEERFGHRFVDCDPSEQTALLDEIAFPDRASEELSHGVAFVNRFRDLTATGFFTSKMGFEDLDYRGNVYVTEWTGCPEEALRKLGLTRG